MGISLSNNFNKFHCPQKTLEYSDKDNIIGDSS